MKLHDSIKTVLLILSIVTTATLEAQIGKPFYSRPFHNHGMMGNIIPSAQVAAV